jgi:L-ascorbate metabolism protein UlaG (beta-lactamase superfamily)
MDTPALVKQTGAIVHGPDSVCQMLAKKGIPANNLEPIMRNKTKSVGSLTWQALWPAEGARRSVSYSIRSDNISLIHFGSASSLFPQIEPGKIEPLDFALIPMDNDSRLADIIRSVANLKPKVVIPHHWDNFNPPLSQHVDLSEFEAALQREVPSSTIYRPVIGKCFALIDLLS